MTINALSAANAYKNQMNLQNDIPDIGLQDESTRPSFSNMLKEGLESVMHTQYEAEAVKIDSMTGKVDLTDLVTSVSNAELSLNTVVAIRDKIISAYQDIIRMPM